MSAIDSMVRVHSWALDEKRRQLRDLQVFMDRLEADLREVDRNIEAERQAAETCDARIAFTYPAFVSAALDRRRALVENIANLERDVEQARDQVAEAFNEFKTYEMARDNQARRKAAERDRRDRLAQDELGLSMYRRGSGYRT